MPRRQNLVNADLKGGKALERALAQLPKSQQPGVLRSALKNAALPVEHLAKKLVPERTGNLKKSIKVGTRLKKSQRRNRGRGEGITVFIGTAWPSGAHGILVEYGTVKAPAQPFLRPAWDSKKQMVLESVEREMWKILAKKAKSLARRAEKGTLNAKTRRALN